MAITTNDRHDVLMAQYEAGPELTDGQMAELRILVNRRDLDRRVAEIAKRIPFAK